MENAIPLMLLLQVVLIALNAIFACAEIAVISISDARLAHLTAQGDPRAARLAQLTRQPARFLATIQVAITLSGFLGSAFAAENFSDPLVDWVLTLGVPVPRSTLEAISVVLITIILSYFTLIFGELVPKRVAMRRAEPLALAMSALISAIARLFAPLVSLLTLSTNAVLRLLGIDPDAEDEEVSEESIRILVGAGGEKGVIDREEQEFIENVFEFDDLTAGEVATHRTDLTLLWLAEDMDCWHRTIRDSRFSRYPVCGDSADDVIGVLDANAYFRLDDHSREAVLAGAVRPAYFVPESVKADVLFRNMRQQHHGCAIVLDEYGGMTGLVTLSDLIEQLVGDLDEAPDPIVPLGDGRLRVSGSISLDELAEALGLSFDHACCETLNGLIFDALGTVPADGSRFSLQTAGLDLEVETVRGHQVLSCLVRPAAPAPAEAPQEPAAAR